MSSKKIRKKRTTARNIGVHAKICAQAFEALEIKAAYYGQTISSYIAEALNFYLFYWEQKDHTSLKDFEDYMEYLHEK